METPWVKVSQEIMKHKYRTSLFMKNPEHLFDESFALQHSFQYKPQANGHLHHDEVYIFTKHYMMCLST